MIKPTHTFELQMNLIPKVLLTRTIVKDGSTYFGPFTEPRHLRLVLKALHKYFQSAVVVTSLMN